MLLLKSPKGEVIQDKNIAKNRAVSLLPEPSGKLPSQWRNHPVYTGDICHPGLSPTRSYLADKEKDGDGGSEQVKPMEACLKQPIVKGSNHKNRFGNKIQLQVL